MISTILLFSGGKDSRLLLDMYKGRLDVDVVFVSTQGVPKDDATYIRSVLHPLFVHDMRVHLISTDSYKWVKKNGWPVDTLPVSHTPHGQVGSGPTPITFQPYTACCQANIWQPTIDFIKQHKVKTVITGQRKDELMRNHLRDCVEQEIDGINWVQPLNDWSADEVFAELKRRGIALLPSYLKGSPSSISCSKCTAYLEKGRGRLDALPEGDRAEVVHVLQYLEASLARDVEALKQFKQGITSEQRSDSSGSDYG